MIPCRVTPKEAVHVTKSTSLKVIEDISSTPCKKLNCTKCCEQGTGTALESDLPAIARELHLSVDAIKQDLFEPVTKYNTTHWKPKMETKPYGKCVFLDKNGCTIQAVKPTGCRLSSWNQHGEQLNEWFDLNYFVKTQDPESVRQWAQRLRFTNTIPGGQLHELVPDTEKLRKILNRDI